ncbi:hypothetical protein [Streptomyces lichenis]|uniref:Uncharacterized protein n=1 Tax=Streptomyces lichenis TaxID=2306967 RepID=A0ABT0I527_9ACTN|nr:hypothetical protein [Streptomyces lichenis]MCK8676441.1 hypothetical protein [Streptomyces lichenis]
MSTSRLLPGLVWMKKEWRLRSNPFPATGVARIGGQDARENGLLYEPNVHAEQLYEVIEKFVLGMSYSGLKFGYLWSVGLVPGDSDARGFGKSVLMQHVAGKINRDFGKDAYLTVGLDEEDAAEVPICCLLTSFDTTHVRSLGAALFAAVEYAVGYHTTADSAPLARRLRRRLIERTATDNVRDLVAAVMDEHRTLRGKTLGPPDVKLIAALCDENPRAAIDYLIGISPISRSRSGAVHMATFLVFAAAAGMRHVMVFCDQLEDLASTTTAKAKRNLEVERFRDVIVETLPMADMLTMVVTMHPRAALNIGTPWALADLPTFDLSKANEGSTVKLPALRDAAQVAQMLRPYLVAATKDGVVRNDGDELFPFTHEAVACLFERSARKPRDVLRKAHDLLNAAAAKNVDRIEAADVQSFLAAGRHYGGRDNASVTGVSGTLDWSRM